MLFRIVVIIQLISFILCNNQFIIESKENDNTFIRFNLGEFDIINEEGKQKINSSSLGKTKDIGLPELPTYSFNFSIESNKDYNVDFMVENYELYENIDLQPSQPFHKVGEDKVFIKNNNFYNSNVVYPENNLSQKIMSLRGYELLNVEFTPFEYNPLTKDLKIYTDVEIVINESGYRDNHSNTPRSEMFENMYKSRILNSDDYQDSRSFQKPSILYICGGNLSSSSYMQDLADWRHKQGYVVNVVSLSETGTSTTSIKNYIKNAYDNWENPPEHVCLVGDANGSVYVPTYTVYGGQGWSSASGEGDFPYTLLEGDDLLPEITIGRISVRSTSEFVTVLNKIIGYEKNYASDTSWLNAMALVGDPYDSGISTVITNEYINQLADIHGGITDIRTKYSGSNFDTFMREQINDGVGYLNYRGFYGFSNFNESDVNQLNNGYKLPVLLTLTCGTGSFSTETTCMTESLFRAGTSVSPKGAAAVIGTAQSYTHTAFNNIVNMGFFEGIFVDNAKTVGEALVYGRLALNEIYPQNPNDNVYLFSTWNNLLGDPSMHLWTSSPKSLFVQHDQLFINGSNNFSVSIIDNHGYHVEGVKVTLLKQDSNGNDEIFVSTLTNSMGIADFYLDDYTSGTVHVTSWGQNYLPEETTFEISQDLPELVLNNDSIVITDVGNADGYWNQGEEVNLSLSLDNNSNITLQDLNMEISSLSSYVNVVSTPSSLGNLSNNGTLNIDNIVLETINNIPYGESPNLRLTIFSDSDDLLWNYIVPIDFKLGNILFSNNVFNDDNGNGLLDRGESCNVSLTLSNSGDILLSDLEATINYSGSQLDFNNNIFTFNNSINVGESTTSTNSVSVFANDDVINGSVVNIPVTFTSSNGFQLNTITTLQVGNVDVGDPLGPDSYGYYIYDMNDTDYELAPDYNWIEIDPDYGGNGDEINLDDGGNNEDDVTTISLPFPFTFYGQEYNEVSVCSNGWIAFGESDLESFRNYTLPGPGGPSPIVAVFWDDLKMTNGGEVYQYYDSSNDSFIIEWSNLRTYFSNSTESFQVILYNTDTDTPTGDDEMKLQYKIFNNTSVGDYPVGNYDGAVVHGQYCTVGIENHLGDDGLQYTFNNVYPTAAMPLSDETALFITTQGSTLLAQPSTNYSVDNFSFNVVTGEEESQSLIIANDGEAGSILNYNIALSPFASNIEEIDAFGYAWTKSDGNQNLEYSWIDISDDNEILEFETNDMSTIVNIEFDFPFYENSYNQCYVNPNGWIGFEEDNTGWNNQSIYDEDSPVGAIFGFWDDLNPSNSGNEVGEGYVRYHSNADRLVIWYDSVVHWTSLDRVYDFQIVLHASGGIDINYQEMLGNIESGTIGIIAPNGQYGLEVVYNDTFVGDNLSLKFDKAPSWGSLDLVFGNQSQIQSGDFATYLVTVNTEGLPIGTYMSYVVINSNASVNSDVIPLVLNIQDQFLIGDVNQDGIIDVIDIVRVVSIIMGNYEASDLEILLSDINEDGQINVVDIVTLVNLILSM